MEKMEQMPQASPPGFSPPPYHTSPVPPQYMQPGPPQHEHVIITSAAFGNDPQHMVCPHCRASISTRVETEANTKTHLFALLLCILGCWCCAPCPYCMDSCMVKKHYCPSCNAYLGSSEN